MLSNLNPIKQFLIRDLLENLVILELKGCLVWKVDLDLQVHLVPQDLQETQFLLLLLLWEEVRLCLEYLVLLDPWVHLGLLVREELMETEDLKEAEEYLEWQDHLEHLAGKVCLEDLEILVNLVNLDVLEDHTLKMISERFVLQFLEVFYLVNYSQYQRILKLRIFILNQTISRPP